MNTYWISFEYSESIPAYIFFLLESKIKIKFKNAN